MGLLPRMALSTQLHTHMHAHTHTHTHTRTHAHTHTHQNAEDRPSFATLYENLQRMNDRDDYSETVD